MHYPFDPLFKSSMNTNTIVALSAAGLIGLYFWNRARTAEYLNYNVKRVTLGFSGVTPVLRFDIGIQNPSGNAFTIRSLTGTLYSGNIRLGEASSFYTMVVQPNAVSTYSIYFDLSIVGLVTTAIGIISDIIALFNGQGSPQQIEFEGAINVDNVTLPLDFKYVIG